MRREQEEIELTGFVQPSEEMRRSWRRRPVEEHVKNQFNKCILFWIMGGVMVTSSIVMIVKLGPSPRPEKEPIPDNATIGLPMALKYFNAQMSGKLPEWNNVSWRGDSCTRDGQYPGSFYPHLAGGYYDDGGAIKSSFPMSYAMTMLSWSVIEYSGKYEAAGELEHVKSLIKWGTDYFLNTFNNSADTISEMVSRIGHGNANDENCWMRPEDINYRRIVSLCFNDCPELAAETAAALASASIVFFNENAEHSARLLHAAKKMYKYGESMSRELSSSGWAEQLWGGAWMYYASGDLTYLEQVTSHHLATRAGAFSSGSTYSVFGLNNKLAGTQLLMTRLRLFLSPPFPYEELLSIYHRRTGDVMCSYLPYYNTFKRTKGGLILLNNGEPQPLQYAANAAFLATLFADYLDAANTPGWYCGSDFFSTQVLRDFSASQIDYILGKNPRNMSYVVGFGQRYPKHVHHRGASIPKNQKASCKGGWKWKHTRKDNPNTILGAMVAGPDNQDNFQDVRTKRNYTEPTLVGNAGLVAALVACSGRGGVDKNSMFMAILPTFPQQPSQP